MQTMNTAAPTKTATTAAVIKSHPNKNLSPQRAELPLHKKTQSQISLNNQLAKSKKIKPQNTKKELSPFRIEGHGEAPARLQVGNLKREKKAARRVAPHSAVASGQSEAQLKK